MNNMNKYDMNIYDTDKNNTNKNYSNKNKITEKPKQFKKKFLTVYRWIIISITLQLMGLIFIDSYVLGEKNKDISTSITDQVDMQVNNESIKILAGASNIKLSYNLNFASYMINGDLVIMDLNKKEVIKEFKKNKENVTCYRWMTDRNMLIYAQKGTKKNFAQVSIVTQDFDNNQNRNLPEIEKLPIEAYINSIEFSHLTNVIYAKIQTNLDERIYSFDIMGEMSFISTVSKGMFMLETNFVNNLLLDDQKGKIKVRSGLTKNTKTLPIEEKVSLLQIDLKDNIYLAERGKDDKVVAILIGKADTKQKEWRKVVLDKSLDIENIIISLEGKMYMNDINKSTLIDIERKTSTKYSGTIVELREEHIITINNSKIIIDSL